MTFSETHLGVLLGNYKNQRALRHKNDLIKAVNAKLGDRKHASSNESIGAVAMLAATEVCSENHFAWSFMLVDVTSFRLTSFVGGLGKLYRPPNSYEWPEENGVFAWRSDKLGMGWGSL